MSAFTDDIDIVIIAAIDENQVIGHRGKIPWNYPKDLEHFRAATLNHPVIMGRRTYESILDRVGHPLEDRTTIVLTNGDIDTGHPNVFAANSLDDALFTAQTVGGPQGGPTDTVYVAGGATVYEQFLSLADQMVITEIHDTHKGTTYFPDWDEDDWVEVDRTAGQNLSFVTYNRVE